MKIGVIGLGYVGLPLAVELSKKYGVIGFDTNSVRVQELSAGKDRTKEISAKKLIQILHDGSNDDKGLMVTDSQEPLASCTFYIITVPTPVTAFKTPDLTPLKTASEIVGKHLKKGNIVIYESTVYPGCTEEDCVPILESVSGLKYNQDFFCGYSPERINPGDRKNTLPHIQKVVSGSTPEALDKIDNLYTSIIKAGTFRAKSIKVAEAAKVIENSQRDVNISFMNELALMFDKMGIDTHDVLEAASTKWNFLRFSPGLVGGHYISVDPYYLMHKSQQLGYNPQVLLSGRTINDNMGHFVASKTIKLMIKHGIRIVESRVLVLGFTFKENCPDIRNTRVIDVVNELKEFGVEVEVYDPFAIPEEVKKEYHISLLRKMPQITGYDGIIVAAGHDKFKEIDFSVIKEHSIVLFDVKGIIDKELVHGRL